MAVPQLLLTTLLSITCGAFAQQGQLHTGMKIQGTKMNVQAPQAVNKLQTNQETGALVPSPPPVPALTVSVKHLPKPPNMAEALVTVPLGKKKEKTVEEKKIDDLKLTKAEKVKLFPCEDYSPICHYYKKDSQCRDYYMQKKCRKYCGLCDVPYGVFIGCADWKACKKFAKSACMIRWVRETCKSKCGQCNHYEREANANIFMGKKRHMVNSKHGRQHGDNKQQLKKVSGRESTSKDTKRKDLEKTAKALLHPKVTVVEKAVPKTKETHVEDNIKGSGVQSKVESTKESSKDENDSDDDNDDDDDGDNHEKKEGLERNDEGDSKDDDNDNDDDDKGKQAKVMTSTSNSHDKPVSPVKMDADPRGEPVVTKLVDQPVKFDQKPNKELKVKMVKQDNDRKPSKVAKPKISDKKAVTPKKMENDKIAKIKPVQKTKKSDKAKTKATTSKKQKN